MKKYCVKRENLVSRVTNISKYKLEGSFVEGSKEEIKGILHILQLVGLIHTMETTQRIEKYH